MSDLFSTGVRPAIDQWLLEESKKERDYGDYWSASSAGYCMRKVIFERLGVPKIESDADARKQRVFTSGHLFHEWIQGITKKAELSIAQELELQDEELMIRGHIDDLVLVGGVNHPSCTCPKLERGVFSKLCPIHGAEMDDIKGRNFPELAQEKSHLILYDYKTVNSRAFMWAKKNGNAMSYYHRMQLGTYMYMLRKNGHISGKAVGNKGVRTLLRGDVGNLTEARILKIEKDTLMMMEQQLMWDDQLNTDILDYWVNLNNYWKNKKMPPCTCEDHEGGFLAKEQYNGFYYNGEPCSLEWYKLKKKEGVLK